MRDGDRLYGRGGADDGYAAFASIAAIEAVQACGGSHGRCLVLIEASEESGSPDLMAHLDVLGDRLGDVALLVCLDSGCATYDTVWLTTSLRGLVEATLPRSTHNPVTRTRSRCCVPSRSLIRRRSGLDGSNASPRLLRFGGRWAGERVGVPLQRPLPILHRRLRVTATRARAGLGRHDDCLSPLERDR